MYKRRAPFAVQQIILPWLVHLRYDGREGGGGFQKRWNWPNETINLYLPLQNYSEIIHHTNASK